MKILIPSRSRAKATTSIKIFPTATYVVPESQGAEYRSILPSLNPVVTVPDHISGMSLVRNTLVKMFDDDIFMVDDDVAYAVSLTGKYSRRMTIEEIQAVIENTAYCAKQVGAPIFGFNQARDVRKIVLHNPISFCSWVSATIGVVDKKLKWDENLKCKCDIDACLTALLKWRVIYRDNRFSFQQFRNQNVGGNAGNTSAAQIQHELEYLRKKWGNHFLLSDYRTQVKCGVRVERRQPLKYYDLDDFAI